MQPGATFQDLYQEYILEFIRECHNSCLMIAEWPLNILLSWGSNMDVNCQSSNTQLQSNVPSSANIMEELYLSQVSCWFSPVNISGYIAILQHKRLLITKHDTTVVSFCLLCDCCSSWFTNGSVVNTSHLYGKVQTGKIHQH